MKKVSVREPAVSGMFYPNDPLELKRMIDAYLARGKETDNLPKAVIVPHAGYIYSGPIAGSVYGLFSKARGKIQRVVLMGPAHRVGFSGVTMSSADAFSTPLGIVPVDQEAVASLSSLKQVHMRDDAHALEHSLEVQLPFLQTVLEDFTLVPLLVGDADPQTVAEVLESLWGGKETLIVISSDLSHYNDYNTAVKMDTATSKAIEALRPRDIDFEGACGRIPIAALLLVAQKRGLHARTVDLRNSGDTAGPKDQVVGYGAYAFE